MADSRLFIIESSKVREPASRVGGGYGKGHGFASNCRESYVG